GAPADRLLRRAAGLRGALGEGDQRHAERVAAAAAVAPRGGRRESSVESGFSRTEAGSASVRTLRTVRDWSTSARITPATIVSADTSVKMVTGSPPSTAPSATATIGF